TAHLSGEDDAEQQDEQDRLDRELDELLRVVADLDEVAPHHDADRRKQPHRRRAARQPCRRRGGHRLAFLAVSRRKTSSRSGSRSEIDSRAIPASSMARTTAATRSGATGALASRP